MDDRSAARGWHMPLNPIGECCDFWKVMRPRAVVAFDPAAYLSFEIALRLAQIGEANRVVVQAVKQSEIIEEGFAQAARDPWGEIQAAWNISAENDAVNRLHQIKGSAQHAGIIAKENHLGCRRIICAK